MTDKFFDNVLDAVSCLADKKCEAVIFDMDGLIFDTEHTFMEQLAVTMKEHGYDLSRELYVESLGLGGDKLRKLMMDEYGENYPFDICSREARNRLTVIAKTVGLTVKAYIPQVLELLKERGITCAVASSTKSSYVKKYLDDADLSKYFRCIIGGESVKRSKPDPDIFLLACKNLGVEPNKALVLEDSENGVRAAYAAGIPVICVPDLKYPCQEVIDMSAAIVSLRH